MIVQLPPPGLTTEPEPQVPPVIEKAPLAPPAVWVIPGAADMVKAPAFKPVAVLVTVMVPVFVFELAGLVVNAGLGPVNDSVAPVTRKAPVRVPDPPGLVTVTLLVPVDTPDGMLKVAVIEVELTTVTPLTVIPENGSATVVPVVVKLLPVIVTSTLVPRTPEGGFTPVTVGRGGF